MTRRWLSAGMAALAAFGLAAAVAQPALGFSTSPTSNFTQVGHDSLYARGMNAAGAMYGHYMYVGSRTDGTPIHTHTGVIVVDVADPANPRNVGEIPLPPKMILGYTSRELRVWPQQKLLIVIYFNCSAILHECPAGAGGDVAGLAPFQHMAFFDLSNPASPRLLKVYKPSVTPHEMFLWVDPRQPASRALMFWTSPNSYNSGKSLVVTDISRWREGIFPEISTFDIATSFTAAQKSGFDVRLHSISLTPDGTRMYLAHLGGGFLVTDTSDFANNVPNPRVRLVTPIANRVYWNNQGAHSSVKVPGKPYVLTTEEIYGKGLVLNQAFGFALSGCPWGWVRMIDVNNEAAPRLVQEVTTPQNTCTGVDKATENFNSFASHNPTLLPDVGILSWHSAGVQALDLSDPTHVTRVGVFSATPETIVTSEDPSLTTGDFKTAMWSYPIIHDGLIYVVDVRNGLFILKYTGPHADEVNATGFLEGNSNLGDAARLNSDPTPAALSVAPRLPLLPAVPPLWVMSLIAAAALTAITSVVVLARGAP